VQTRSDTLAAARRRAHQAPRAGEEAEEVMAWKKRKELESFSIRTYPYMVRYQEGGATLATSMRRACDLASRPGAKVFLRTTAGEALRTCKVPGLGRARTKRRATKSKKRSRR
jgi:hypothetical protein